MKKALRMIGMVVMTILMSVNFSSCGESDDDENGIENPNPGKEEVSSFKKIAEFIIEDNMDKVSISIKYDNQGRMIEHKTTWEDNDYEVMSFSYSDSKIELLEQNYRNGKLSSSYNKYLILENGRIVDWDSHKCYYDAAGHLVKIQDRVDITWEGDNIVKVDDTKVTPSDIDFMKSEPESFPSEFLMEEEFFWRTGTMLGKRPAKSSLYSPWGTELIRESDMNGYVTKCSCNMWTKTVIWK